MESSGKIERISLRDWNPKRNNALIYSSEAFFSLLFRYMFDQISITGVKNIPKKARVLLACNHQSYLDPPLVGWVICKKLKKFYSPAANEKLFYISILAKYMENVDTFPVPQAMTRSKLEEFTEVYSEIIKNKNLIWFPQGGRGRKQKNKLRKYRAGMILPAMLAALKDPSLEIAVVNTKIDYRVVPEDFFKQNGALKSLIRLYNSSSVSVSFSEPVYLTKTIDDYCKTAGVKRGEVTFINLKKARSPANEFMKQVEAQRA